MVREVQFALDSADLTAAGKATLDEMAGNLARLKFISGTVTGHTDSTGSDTYNQSLSERRAKTVARYLEGKGIAVGRLTTSGAGESKPIADNATKEGRAKNRRVVLSRTHLEVQVLYTPDTGICARSARPCASNRSTIRPAGEVGSLLS